MYALTLLTALTIGPALIRGITFNPEGSSLTAQNNKAQVR